MRRREFIAGLGSATALPLAAYAQQRGAPTVGALFVGIQAESGSNVLAFRKGLSEMGFVEGRNLTIEYRWAEDQFDRLPALAADLVQRRVAVILAGGGTPAVTAAKTATSTIPIVFYTGGDPVEDGIVASFNRPGGNVTGISVMTVALTGKRFELLHNLVPSASRFALLVNPGNPHSSASLRADAEAAAAALGRQIEVFTASTNDEIDAAFASMLRWRAEALLIGTTPLFGGRGARQLAALALRHALPAMGFARDYSEVGGLMSYGSSFDDGIRQAGIYVGRVLKGEKPADLPVAQPTKFTFVINLTTAKVIGLEVPPTLLALADEVIE
jgi:ABC-type uncharacterized transport system substrate-binding protein